MLFEQVRKSTAVSNFAHDLHGLLWFTCIQHCVYLLQQKNGGWGEVGGMGEGGGNGVDGWWGR